MAEPTGDTPRRSVRIPNPLWDAARALAAERGETVTDAVIRGLETYVDGGGVVLDRELTDAEIEALLLLTRTGLLKFALNVNGAGK